MKIFAPDYYKSFKCLADKCTHSCCIGWDVYIDEETQIKYSAQNDALGLRIKNNLAKKEDGVCFEMRGDGRCPFLNDSGLCDIITEKGEEHISEICREHPRFYSFFSDRTEMGIGLSCEAAARIILSQTAITELVVIDDDEWISEEPSEWELVLKAKREELYSIIQGEGKSVNERAKAMLDAANADFSNKGASEWRSILQSLERLDSTWDKYLDLLYHFDDTADTITLEKPLEKLLLYFVYRHTASAEDEEEFSARVAFAYLSYLVVRAICIGKIKKDGKCSLADLCEFARAYSAEIEYSEENTEALIDIFR